MISAGKMKANDFFLLSCPAQVEVDQWFEQQEQRHLSSDGRDDDDDDDESDGEAWSSSEENYYGGSDKGSRERLLPSP